MIQKVPLEKIVGERLELRKHVASAALEVFRLVDQDRVRLGRFLPWVAGVHGPSDSEDYLRHAIAEWEAFRLFDFSIFVAGVYAGTIGAHRLDWDHGCCEIGYWLGGAFEGQGLMSEALALLEEELFRLGFHRLEIRCNPRNVRSAAVPKRAGYRLDGILREDKIEVDGSRRDTMIWGKLAGDRAKASRREGLPRS